MKTTITACLLTLLAAPVWATEAVSVGQLKQRMASQNAPVLIDVRTEEEYLAGHIPGAIMIPVKRLDANLDMLEPYRQRELVVYCQSGRRARQAAQTLGEAGFKRVKLLEGSYQAWQQAR